MVQKKEDKKEEVEIIEGEMCPFCHHKTLQLSEIKREIPYFGPCYIFSMNCTNCKYHKSDVETENNNGSVKYELLVDNEEDLKIRVVKSSNANVKLGSIGTIEAGENANGYITNIEGLINRMKHQIESVKNVAQDNGDKDIVKKCKNALKKITRVLWGQESLKITLKDPTGNSAIISDKVIKKK